MLHEPIHQQLARLGLRGAADALARLPLNDDLVDTLAALLEAECLHRDSLAQARRLKLARLGQRAHPADVDLRAQRGLSKARWAQLLSLNWFKQHQHVLIVGPTGIGKSYLSCALAKAVIDTKHSVRYLRLPRLGDELSALQALGRTSHWLKTLSRIDLLILDDFGLVSMSESHQPLLLELLEDRHQRGSGGACHNADSPWRDWFTFSEEGQAHNWLGYASLPKLDYRSTSLVNEIYAGEDSIVRHWLKAPWSMDGWRLDVVHMLGEAGGARNNLQHVAGITRSAKAAQPEAFVFGEHFGDARQWLQNDAEDAAMNYRGFTFPLWGFLANTDISYDPQHIDAETCMAWMDNYRASLSHQQQLRMFNQLDSHDTARFKSLLGKDVARLPLAVVWLFCWPGVPCIYYGDEIGMNYVEGLNSVEGGYGRTGSRSPMQWDSS